MTQVFDSYPSFGSTSVYLQNYRYEKLNFLLLQAAMDTLQKSNLIKLSENWNFDDSSMLFLVKCVPPEQILMIHNC